ncbi:MAG: hypothetical protein HY293_22695 [Planctomycetes bacterium]|nr:hypothetical protein [Planctomycetota bacterium]
MDENESNRSLRASLAFTLALAAALTALALPPIVLLKPGRLLLTPEGTLIINPVSFRGLGVLMAAEVAAVFGVLLMRSLFTPRASMLPIPPALAIIAACGLAVGSLGVSLLRDPWMPDPETAIALPPTSFADLAGFACAFFALAGALFFKPLYDDFWGRTAAGRPLPETPSGLGGRIWHGLFMGGILGTLAGAFGAIGGALLAHSVGVPSRYKGAVVIWCGFAISLAVQVWCLRSALRGRRRRR